MSTRTATIERNTAETRIRLELNLDGQGRADIQTPVGFLTHMLELFARHGRFDLTLAAAGDTHVDSHHLVEDVGICLGKALAEAVGDKAGINRYGSSLLPMDEVLMMVAVDLSGRACPVLDISAGEGKLGEFDVELTDEFFIALANNARMNLHVRCIAGRNRHHIIEAAFKGVARALREAVAADPRASGEIPSTKGVL